MGPYCQFCDNRCFVLRRLKDGREMLLATCGPGMAQDRKLLGEDADTALNPYAPEPEEVEDDEEDLGECGYYARYVNLPGHDPEAICMQTGICWEAGEPLCVTCEPTGGWPSMRKLAKELRDG